MSLAMQTSKRLIWRRMNDSDFAFFGHLFDDADVRRYWRTTWYKPGRLEQKFREAVETGATARLGSWFLVNKDTGTEVGFGYARDNNGHVSIGCVIDRNARGQGFASEFVREVLRLAFADPSVRSVGAPVKPENMAGVRVLQKSRMVLSYYDDPDNRYHFGITRDEWESGAPGDARGRGIPTMVRRMSTTPVPPSDTPILDRLYLRPVAPDDAMWLYLLFDSCGPERDWSEGGALSPVGVEALIEWGQNRFAIPPGGCWILVEKESGLEVGYGMARVQPSQVACLVGCVIDESFRGRGYAPEFVRYIVRRSFTIPSVNRVWADIREDNAAGMRAAAKAGLVECCPDDELPGRVLYHLPREDYLATPPTPIDLD